MDLGISNRMVVISVFLAFLIVGLAWVYSVGAGAERQEAVPRPAPRNGSAEVDAGNGGACSAL